MRRQFGILAPLRVRLFPGLSGLFGPMGLPLHLKTPFRLPALSHQRSLSAHERSYQYYSVSRKCIQSDNAGLIIYKIIILMIIGRVHTRNYQCPEIFRSLFFKWPQTYADSQWLFEWTRLLTIFRIHFISNMAHIIWEYKKLIYTKL